MRNLLFTYKSIRLLNKFHANFPKKNQNISKDWYLNIHKKIIFTLHYFWESNKFHLEPLHFVSHLVKIYRKQNKTLSD